MNFADRNTRLLFIAGSAAVLAVLFTFLVRPMMSKWSELGDLLEPKQSQIEQVRAQVEGHESLIAKRDALVRRLGSLLGRPAATKPDDATPPAAPQKSADDKQPPEGEKKVEAPAAPAAQTADAPPAGEAAKPQDKSAEAKPSSPPEARAGEKGPAQADASPKKEGADQSVEKPAEKPKEANPDSGAGDRRLAAYIDKTAGQSGVKIKRVSAKKSGSSPRGAKSFVPVTLQLSVEGNAESMMKFLHQIEKGDRFARIDQCEFHRDAAKGGSVDANLDISGYQE